MLLGSGESRPTHRAAPKQKRPARALLARPVSNCPNAVGINSAYENDQLVNPSQRVVNLSRACQESREATNASHRRQESDASVAPRVTPHRAGLPGWFHVAWRY